VLLNSRYQLHDLGDVEALCARAARGWATKTEARLSPEDFESLVAFLVASVWRMSLTYDPARSSSFKAIVLGRLGNRSTDWFRQHRGRTRWRWSDGTSYERERPNLVSLDANAGDDGRPLVESVADWRGDPAADSGSPALRELLADRDREAAWDQALVRAAARRHFGDRAVVERR
jgi:hypothetical protein